MIWNLVWYLSWSQAPGRDGQSCAWAWRGGTCASLVRTGGWGCPQESSWRGPSRSSAAGPPSGCCRWLPGAHRGSWAPASHIHTGRGTSYTCREGERAMIYSVTCCQSLFHQSIRAGSERHWKHRPTMKPWHFKQLNRLQGLPENAFISFCHFVFL